MTLDWRKHGVQCGQCGAPLRRRLYRPADNAKIENFFCDRACKGAWQIENLRPISVDDLRRMYVDEKLSANEIAKIVGRNSKRVWEWLQLDGVATRPRGHDVRQQFKPGQRIRLGSILSEEHKQRLREARIADGSVALIKARAVYGIKGRTGEDHPCFKGGLTPERQSFYGSAQWRDACVVVWYRADAKCERCGLDHRLIDRSAIKFHIHHIVSFQVRELRAEPTNLALLCIDCHHFVHGKSNVERIFMRAA